MDPLKLNYAIASFGAEERYCAGAVSWNDGQRGVTIVNGTPTLSALGNNITDVYIATKNDKLCQFMRPLLRDERVGLMQPEGLLTVDKNGASVSVRDILDSIEERSKYMGYTSVKPKYRTGDKVVVRFQTAWVPIPSGATRTEIVPKMYSYQTFDRSNPRNLNILGTPQGCFVHSDAPGANPLFAHTVDDEGVVHNHWFEAEPNRNCHVGQAVERDDSSVSNKAKAVEMGIRGMGHRTNCFVTIAIPNKQKVDKGFGYRSLCGGNDESDGPVPVYRALNNSGTSFAARISMAKESVGNADANAVDIERPDGEPIVVTVLTYNTIQVPEGFQGDPTTVEVSLKDVEAGIRDLDRQYELVLKNHGVVCNLSELPAMLHKLTDADIAVIKKKMKDDPMSPHPSALAAFA